MVLRADLSHVSREPILRWWRSGSDELATATMSWAESGLVVRRVRGSRMRSLDGLFDEFSAAFQFPSYFGYNRDAFNECIRDLVEWLPTVAGFVIVLDEYDEVLDTEPLERPWFFDALELARAALAEPVADQEWWDRSPLAFHVVGKSGQDSDGPVWLPSPWSVAEIL